MMSQRLYWGGRGFQRRVAIRRAMRSGLVAAAISAVLTPVLPIVPWAVAAATVVAVSLVTAARRYRELRL